MRTISPAQARRLAITRQFLAGPRPRADAEGILGLVRELGCLQLDPISAVARSHLLVLWSRLGRYDPSVLDTLLWQNRRLFEYWAHAASIVLTEDYPIHSLRMRAGPSAARSWERRVWDWVEANSALREQILSQLRQSGPLPARAFDSSMVSVSYLTFVEGKGDATGDRDSAATGEVRPGGWNWGRSVDRMLSFLWSRGEIMVTGRSGGQKLWDLSERCLPVWTPREPLTEPEAVRASAQRALRALGVATETEISWHFTRHRYPGLKAVLADLEAEGRIERLQVSEQGACWPGVRYIHTEDLPLLDRLASGEWEPRTTLLSPFDNLICDRGRTERLFNFDFRIEIYVPPAKRTYGYYVLPILHGDRLIGRIDPTMDRRQKRLTINAVHAEPDAPLTDAAARAVAGAVEALGAFLGAREIAYSERLPDAWGRVLRRS
jgi:uncharacterized protein YcaQ